MSEESSHVACSECFNDVGLKLDAQKIGISNEDECLICLKDRGQKLSFVQLEHLAHRFFVWGSLHKYEYGAAPVVQFNKHQNTSINISPWLKDDIKIFERVLGVGFFHYGPRLWMIGEVEPLKALQNTETMASVVDRIINEYPSRTIDKHEIFYRIRKTPNDPDNWAEYDSQPEHVESFGRLNSKGASALYVSSDLDVCVHECRVTAEDDLFVATLHPKAQLRLLDLSILLKEENVTEFESLDMAVHMIFLAAKHSYEITRSIASSAKEAGFDGIIYPSYFSLLRSGVMPFQTVYGISNRRIPQYQEIEQAIIIPNIAVFGRPLREGKVVVKSINRLILSRVEYNYHFGPASA